MVFPILIAEDDPKIANVVRVYLENDGYRVVMRKKEGRPSPWRRRSRRSS